MSKQSQVIAHGAVGSSHIGEAATRRFQLITIRSGLGLEKQGIKIRRGVTMLAVAKRLTGLRSNDRDVQINRINVMIRELEARIEFVEEDADLCLPPDRPEGA